MQKIKVIHSTMGGTMARGTFATIERARAAAERVVGASPKLENGFAWSDDGKNRIEVRGCKIVDLFPSRC